ncbi:MAG: hypothetical protein AAF653_08430 [Chloroflexota bacterium]
MTGITVSWTDSRRVALLLDFPDEWTWDDLYLIEETVHSYAAQVSYTVDLVYLLDGQNSLPRNCFRHMRSLADRYPDNIGLVIWTGCSRLTMEMIRSVARSYPDLAQRYAFATDLLEAMRYPGP